MRFQLLRREDAAGEEAVGSADKMSLAFAVEHRPGTLVAALERLALAGVDLTKIESRPVPGSPWEYVFYVDIRFEDTAKKTYSQGLPGTGREIGRAHV